MSGSTPDSESEPSRFPEDSFACLNLKGSVSSALSEMVKKLFRVKLYCQPQPQTNVLKKLRLNSKFLKEGAQ